MKTVTRVLAAADRGVARVETAALVCVVAALLVIAVVQVVLKLCGAGLQWMEMLGRWLVLWVGFLGGAVASHQGRHITIDVFSRFARGTTRRVLGVVVNTVGAALSLALLKISWSYLGQKVSDGSVAFSVGRIEVPEWWMASVVPAGLALMAWHFAVQAVTTVSPLPLPPEASGPGGRGEASPGNGAGGQP